MSAVHTIIPPIWGALLLFVSIANYFVLAYRLLNLGAATAFIGFLCWMFASIMFAQQANIVILLSVGVPNLWFWVWYYLRVKLYFKLVAQHMVLSQGQLVEALDNKH